MAEPDPGKLFKGTGIAYFKRAGETAYRDLGSADLVETTPTIGLTNKMAARGGSRYRLASWVSQREQSFSLHLAEWQTQNLALALGGSVTDALSLSTTADTSTSSKTLSNLGSTAGLTPGQRHWISGTGIPANTSFIYGGEDDSPDTSVLLDRAATATGTGVAVTITRPASIKTLEDAQITGAFAFASDNDTGPRIGIEALNVVLTPNGTIQLLDSSGDDPADIQLTIDVLKDDYGNFTNYYDFGEGGDIWVPA